VEAEFFSKEVVCMMRRKESMKAYSQDLRERILQTVNEGKTQAEAA